MRGIKCISGNYLYQVKSLSPNAYLEAELFGQPAELASRFQQELRRHSLKKMTTEKRNMESLRLSECLAEYPNEVLDAVRKRLRLKNDAALSRTLGISPSTISNIRRGKIPLRSVILVRMLETTHLHIRDLYNMSQGSTSKRRTGGGKTTAPTVGKGTGTRSC